MKFLCLLNDTSGMADAFKRGQNFSEIGTYLILVIIRLYHIVIWKSVLHNTLSARFVVSYGEVVSYVAAWYLSYSYLNLASSPIWWWLGVSCGLERAPCRPLYPTTSPGPNQGRGI